MSNRTITDGDTTVTVRVLRRRCSHPADFQWTDESEATVCRMWMAGKSVSEIAEAVGVSRNAIVGKVRRLKLPPRPSPIKRVRDGYVPKFVPEVKPRITLPPMPSATDVATLGLAPLVRQYTPPIPRPVQRAPEPPREPAPKPAFFFGRPVKCQYPMGNPRDPGFRFCEEPSMPGVETVYCGKHHRLCHVRPGERQEDEANVPGPASAWGGVRTS